MFNPDTRIKKTLPQLNGLSEMDSIGMFVSGIDLPKDMSVIFKKFVPSTEGNVLLIYVGQL